MANKDVIKITIPIGDKVTHTHAVELQYDDENDVMATDFILEVIDLMKCVFGETDTDKAYKKGKLTR